MKNFIETTANSINILVEFFKMIFAGIGVLLYFLFNLFLIIAAAVIVFYTFQEVSIYQEYFQISEVKASLIAFSLLIPKATLIYFSHKLWNKYINLSNN